MWTAYLVVVHLFALIGVAVVALFLFADDPRMPTASDVSHRR